MLAMVNPAGATVTVSFRWLIVQKKYFFAMNIFALELDEACKKRQITVFFDYADNTVYFGDIGDPRLRFTARMPREFVVEYEPAQRWQSASDNDAVSVQMPLATMRALIESSCRNTCEAREKGEQCGFAIRFHERLQRLLGTA